MRNTYNNLLQLTCIALIMGVFFTSSLIAQEKKIAFEKYGVAEGLPEEFVSSMVQDEQGFMWFTTQNGLVKFDGYKMKVYKASKNRNDSTNLQSRNLGSILKTKDSKLWFGSDGSYTSFNPITEKFRTYELSSLNNTRNYSEVMFEDNDSNIWTINSTNKLDSLEITRLNTKTHVSKSYPHQMYSFKLNDILSNGQMVFSKSDNSVWINDNSGNLMVYDRQTDKFNTVVSAGSEIPGSKISDTIQNIVKGNGKHFLLVSENSLVIWDPVKKNSITSYTNYSDKDNTFLDNKIGSWVFEDTKGQYWINLENGMLLMINPENKKNSTFIYDQDPLKFPNAIKNPRGSFPIYQNDNGIWFAIANSSKAGFIYYDHLKKSFHYYNEQFNDIKNSFILNPNYVPIYQMMMDKTGFLWFGTRPNFYKESPKTRQINLFSHNSKDKYSIPSDTINQIFEDTKQRLWVATDRGLSKKQENNTFKQFYFTNTNGSLTTLGKVNGVYEDSKSNIWVRTNGNGLLQFDEAKQEFIKCSENIGKNIWNIQEDKHGNFWVNSYNGGVKIIDGNTTEIIKSFSSDTKNEHDLISPRVSRIFLDSRGSIWLSDAGDNDFGLFKYIEKEEKFKHYKNIDNDSLTINSNEIRNFIEDDKSRMWVNTDGGVNLYDHERDVFYPSKSSVNMSSSRTFIKGANGKIWVATYAGGGLAQVGPNIDDIVMYGEDKGLLHNDVTNLVLDDYGKLWLPTERGLSVLDTLTKTYTSYFEKDGFQKYSRSNTILKTHDGDIWIGGKSGLNHIVPGKLAKKDMTVPAVYITDMGIMDSIYSKPDGDIFSKAVSYTDKVKIKYWQKNVSFSFVGLHYSKPEDNQYSWKLENYDTNWSTSSKERHAAYTNLSPGTYTFKVKASNADGVWNEEGASIIIVITPPWWQTWWAYVLYGLLFLLVAYRIHGIQRQKTLRKEREKTQQKELEQAKEIEKAYTELKSTQSQLIQSEKMASLGELTAGIAHEIQNPLNFVNNFSEVSNELVDEMNEELDKGDFEEAKAISKDIKQNLEKINHHGKRADSIVKGMLQHSRNNSGEKENVDLNNLTDEFFRLAYHGLRAKDKSFNATLETNFDPKLGEIEVVSQEIGRVILNLFTNAFYAVNEKQASAASTDYKPTVSVITKRLKNSITIAIKDNGNGIPKNVVDKIFEPFFTTKPTGKGTGLGLSMSYDIIKAHNGQLEVSTNTGEFTEFKITLPLKTKKS